MSIQTWGAMMDGSSVVKLATAGEKAGKLRGCLDTDSLRALGHPETPIRAIRAYCVWCSCGSLPEVRRCPAIHCPLWPYRMGQNPFHGKGSGSQPALNEPEIPEA